MTFDPTEFSSDFDTGEEPEPSPDEEPQDAPPDEDGPWISHGTVHVGHKPNH